MSMKLWQRYSKLTLWNKVGFWGAVASIVGLALYFVGAFRSPSSTATAASLYEPVIELDYRGDDIFINNRGHVAVSDLKLYPVLYTVNEKMGIHDRQVTAGPTFTLDGLAEGETILVPKDTYLDEKRYRSMKFADKALPCPLVAFVLVFRRAADNKRYVAVDPFVSVFEDRFGVFPLKQVDQMAWQGGFEIWSPVLDQIASNERRFFNAD